MMAERPNTKEAAVTTLLRGLVLRAALISAGAVCAQGYPNRPIRMIVPFTAGGPTDVIARIVAQRLSETWGQQVVTENQPGASGNIGVVAAAKAAPDGYTVLAVSTGFLVNPSMYARVGYDPVKDFSPISLVASSPNVVIVHPSLPAKTLKELVDLIKAHPGNYSFAQLGLVRRRTSPANCSSCVMRPTS
jgi:tripartite-type tricarboxylate transporter receptor subunit TctC